MNGQTVFNIGETDPGIVRSNFRMTDGVISDYVMGDWIILKMEKFQSHFWKRDEPRVDQNITKLFLYKYFS